MDLLHVVCLQQMADLYTLGDVSPYPAANPGNLTHPLRPGVRGSHTETKESYNLNDVHRFLRQIS